MFLLLHAFKDPSHWHGKLLLLILRDFVSPVSPAIRNMGKECRGYNVVARLHVVCGMDGRKS